MIDLAEIEAYNKVVAYSKKRYRPWDAGERKAMEEAAPLIKFTLTKSILQAEDRHIQHILKYSKLLGATHVVITCDQVQFFVDLHSPIQLDVRYCDRSAVFNLFVGGADTNALAFTRVNTDSTHKLLTVNLNRYEQYRGFLPHDTKRDGLYVLNDQHHTFVHDRKSIERVYDQAGYVIKPGNPPTVVPVHEMSKPDLAKVGEVVAFCDQMGRYSMWTQAMIKPLQKFTKMYRSPVIEHHKSAIKQLIKGNRVK